MSFAVVSYPKISKKDFDFIQNHRRINDTKYFHIIDPHFAVIFPTTDFSKSDFIDEVVKQTTGITKFAFIIRCATTNLDFSNKFFHEFLVPDEGYSKIVKLHDKLYSGRLIDNLRLDIDFIPHIGIGNSEDVSRCKKNIDKLNSQNLIISGSVQTLDIVKYENNKIETIKKVDLV